MVDRIRDHFWLRDMSPTRDQERQASILRAIRREYAHTGRPHVPVPPRAQRWERPQEPEPDRERRWEKPLIGNKHSRIYQVVYLHTADKYHGFTHRPSQEQKGLGERAVVYGYITDNSGVGACSKMDLFHPHGRGPHHGTERVVLPTPRGCSCPHLSPHPCRVARQAPSHAPAAPRIQAATHTLQRTHTVSRADLQTAV
jgi:hypothetical protein